MHRIILFVESIFIPRSRVRQRDRHHGSRARGRHTAGIIYLLCALSFLLAPSAFAACANPAGNEGDMIYNVDFHTLQFCDNTNWVRMGGATLDDRIGTLTNNKWCNSDGVRINCTLDAPGADNLGNHIATQNIQLGSYWLSGDGGNEGLTVDANGNVGIGTTNPARLLHVAGAMRLTPGALPGSPAAGDIAIDSGDSNKLKYYDGSAWQTGPGGGGGSTEISFRAIGSTTSLSSGNWTDLVFPTVVQTGGTNYATGTGKFTAPSDGTYVFHASVYVPTASSYLKMTIQTSAANDGGTTVCYSNMTFASTGGTTAASCSGAISLTAGQVIEVTAQQNTGSAVTASSTYSVFSGFKVGDGGGSGGGGGGSATAAGNVAGAMQFNNGSDAFASDDANLVWNDTANALGIGTATPNTSALLDLTSTTKGLLLPRLTTTQVGNVSSPADGLLVYDTNTDTVKVRANGAWVSVGSGDGGSGSTMVSNWPDAIRCYGSTNEIFLYHQVRGASNAHIYASTTSQGNTSAFSVAFNSSGTWTNRYGEATFTGYYETNCNSGSTTIASLYSAGNAFNFVGGGSGSGVSDGDKGDITVSSSGAAWAVDSDAITYAKIQNVSATNKLLGRATAGAGDIEELGLGTGLSLATSNLTLDTTLVSLAGYNTDGILVQTAADTFVGRAITGTANEINVTNGDGVSGNPTLALASVVNLASKTLRLPSGTSLPGTCSVGDVFMDTDATTGQRFYLCQAANTWALQGDGLGGASITAAGSDTQVQFNDGGTSLGADAGFTYNKTTDSLAINGGLTVDTTTLAVDAANNAVGIGTTTPSQALEVVGTAKTAKLQLNKIAGAALPKGVDGLAGGADGNVMFNLNNALAGDSDFSWNNTSKRLGIGTATPSYALQVASGQVAGAGAYVNTSDGRLKTNIHDIPYGLAAVAALRPVSFEWKEQKADWQKGRKLGLIAQEAEQIVPEVVSTAGDEMGTKSIAYGDLVPVLIQAVKDLKAANDAQEAELEAVRAEIDRLKSTAH